jgi:hypothetical protein
MFAAGVFRNTIKNTNMHSSYENILYYVYVFWPSFEAGNIIVAETKIVFFATLVKSFNIGHPPRTQ